MANKYTNNQAKSSWKCKLKPHVTLIKTSNVSELMGRQKVSHCAEKWYNDFGKEYSYIL